MRYTKIFTLLNNLDQIEGLLKAHKANVVKKGQCKLVLGPEYHKLPINKISPCAIKAIKRLKQAGYKAYLVGGGVRDLLLGKTPKDFDVSTSATPEEVAALFNNARIIGRRFKIVHLNYGGDNIIEVTTFRKGDSKSVKQVSDHPVNNQHYRVQANDSGMLVRDNNYSKRLSSDAKRRDFTINAIYFDVETGELIDYHGGLYDLTQGVIDIIGDPDVRYHEDPVRILRAARFVAKLNFKLSKRTLEAIEPCAHLLKEVSNARMYDEVNKLFLTGHAQASYKVLVALNLFNKLLYVPDNILHNKTFKEFINLAFAETDNRFKDKRCNMPHFLYALVLWNTFIWEFYNRSSQEILGSANFNCHDLIYETAFNVLSNQIKTTALPEMVIDTIVSLWSSQFLLENRDPANTSFRSFRAAFDLFKLRAQVDPNLQDLVEFWQPHYEKCKLKAEQIRQKKQKNKELRREQRNKKKKNKKYQSSTPKFDESASAKQKRIDKAREWRENMKLDV